jgi:outer membrane lipoprotein
MKLMTALALALTLGACASAPKPLQGQFSTLLPDDAAKREASGELVRWGGHIVSVETQSQRSCFEIVAAPLTITGRPQNVDRSEGRFIACRGGFYEPEVFKAGREITISGRIESFETRKVGGYDYRYPRVAADVVYLWPERRDVDVIVEPRPFFGWYGGWYGRRW